MKDENRKYEMIKRRRKQAAGKKGKGIRKVIRKGRGKGEGKQGRIHGQYQSRMGGQGRKCVFSHFSTRSPRINRPTDGRTDKASYRDAWTHLKKVSGIESEQEKARKKDSKEESMKVSKKKSDQEKK